MADVSRSEQAGRLVVALDRAQAMAMEFAQELDRDDAPDRAIDAGALDSIRDERSRQRTKGFTAEHDDAHAYRDLFDFVRIRAAMLAENSAKFDVGWARWQMVQIAALAVATIEKMDRAIEGARCAIPTREAADKFAPAPCAAEPAPAKAFDMAIKIDPTLPPGTIEFVNESIGRIVGRIANVRGIGAPPARCLHRMIAPVYSMPPTGRPVFQHWACHGCSAEIRAIEVAPGVVTSSRGGA